MTTAQYKHINSVCGYRLHLAYLFLWYFPEGQSLHVSTCRSTPMGFCTMLRLLHLPGSHGLHCFAPVMSVTSPAAQNKQSISPAAYKHKHDR
jgi:hypothetical protein